MRTIRFTKAAILLSFLLFTLNAHSEEIMHASDLQIQGNKRIDIEAIKLQIKSNPSSFSSEDISKDVTTLYQTGFFDKVDATLSDSNGSHLIFKVSEKPLVRKVFIKGNDDISEGDLAEILKFGEKRFFDKNKVSSLERNVVTFYQTKGYNDAAISHESTEVGDNQVDVTFSVTEGKRYKLRKISFRGLNLIDADDLKDVMQTRTYSWYKSWILGTGRASEEVLQADRAAIRQFFLDHGFIEGTVSEANVTSEKDSGDVEVSFDVHEGKEFKIGKITASGDLVEDNAEKTLDGIKSKEDKVFNGTQIRQDSFTISDKFGDQGYAFANVVPNTDVKSEDGIVNIDFQTTKGKKVSINRINIKGNEKTYDNVIRRELKVQESQLYSSSKIKRSQALLTRLGYFDEVNITNETIPGRDDLVDLNVNVKEAKTTGSFSVGAGYSTTDGTLFNARLSENNIFGTGRRLDLNADIGSQRNNVSAAVSDRRLLDTDLSGSVEGFRSSRTFYDFEKILTGGAVSFGYPLENWFGETFEDFNTNIRFEGANVDINRVEANSAILIRNSAGTSSLLDITPSITRNTINNPLNPTSGSMQVLSFETAGFGGDNEYYLVEARNTVYYPFAETSIGDFTFSNRTRFGYGKSLNDDPFPLFKRYFPGGINSVRGYDPRKMGPSENGSVYGGSKQFINNAEMLFPLINSAGIKGVLFYDCGQAFIDNQSIDFSLLRQSWGFGIRWLSPMGPLRFEFGFPIARKEGEDSMQPMFTFGAPM